SSHQDDAEPVRHLRVGLCREGAGLLVQRAHIFEAGRPAYRIDQVHTAAAGQHEHVLHARARHELHHVIGKLLQRVTIRKMSSTVFVRRFQGCGNTTPCTPSFSTAATLASLSSTKTSASRNQPRKSALSRSYNGTDSSCREGTTPKHR